MKVLMLGWELPPNNSGGLGVACLQLSKALAAGGADIDFILPFYDGPRHDFMRVTSALDSGAQYIVMAGAYDSYRFGLDDGHLERLSAQGQQETYAQIVGRIVERLDFDIIHAHDWLTFRAALMAREKKNVPLIVHVHSIERDRAGGQPGNPWVREVEATAMMLADHVIAVSQRTKQMITEDYNIPADKIEVVHNSLDSSVLEPLDGQNAYKYLTDMRARGWKVIVSVGRMTIQKGLPHLLAAAGHVIHRRPNTLLLFVGDGEQRDELLELAAEYGIARNVLFTGFQRGKNWRDAYAAADLFVMPSVSEPFGLTPFEAAAYGVPSLISKQSGAAEIFRNCLKVDFWDVNEMANQMLAVLREDPLRFELSDKAGQELGQQSWSRAADKVLRRYRQMTMEAAR